MNDLKDWVNKRLMPHMTRNSINYNISSYQLKHVAERELGCYVSNEELMEVLTGMGVKCICVRRQAYYPLRSRWNKC